jgi:methionine-gamma-lyase
MTHAGMPEDMKAKTNVTEKLIRFSVGIEHPDDLMADIEQAFQ